MDQETGAKTRQNAPGGPAPLAARTAALEALLSGASMQSAAKAAEIDRHTLAKWMREGHEFRAEYEERRAELLSGMVEALALGKRVGFETLLAAARNGDVKAATELFKAGEPLRLAGADGGAIKADVAMSIEGLVRIARTKEDK